MSDDCHRSQLDTPLKNRIVGHIEATQSVAKASAYYQVAWSTCHDVFHWYQETGTTSNLPRSGWPTILSPRGQRRFGRTALKEDSKSIREVANDFSPKISRVTAQRVLKNQEIYRFRRKRVPYLSEGSRMKRLQFAYQNRSKTAQYWGRIFFTDETYIFVSGKHTSAYVTRHRGDGYRRGKTRPTFTQPRTGVMVWACVALGKKGPNIVLDFPGGKGGGMNGLRYQEQVLERVFLPYIDSLGPEGHQFMFQQDNAPGHRAKSTKNWFTSHNIMLFTPPPSSPDLNPIELVWNLLRIELEKRQHIPTSKDELKQAIYEAWEQISQADIDACILKMDKKVEAVIAAQGGNIKG